MAASISDPFRAHPTGTSAFDQYYQAGVVAAIPRRAHDVVEQRRLVTPWPAGPKLTVGPGWQATVEVDRQVQ
jgi:hypothetical protein